MEQNLSFTLEKNDHALTLKMLYWWQLMNTALSAPLFHLMVLITRLAMLKKPKANNVQKMCLENEEKFTYYARIQEISRGGVGGGGPRVNLVFQRDPRPIFGNFTMLIE